MKKILILLAITLSCMFTVIGLNLSNAAKDSYALNEEYNIVLTTNYNLESGGLLMIIIEDELGIPLTEIKEGAFSINEPDAAKIKINVDTSFLTSDYVKDLEGIYVNDNLFPQTGGTAPILEYVIDIASEITKIEIKFDLAEFDLTAIYREYPYTEISETLDNNTFIKFYRIINGQKSLIQNGKIYYGEILEIEPVNKITFNNKKLSFSFESLYFNIPNETMVCNGRYEIKEDFIKEYMMSDIISLVAIYSRDFSLSLKFNNENYEVPFNVFIVNGNKLMPAEKTDLFSHNTKIQISMELKDYTELNAFNVEDLNYAENSEDKVVIEDRNVIITFTITRDKNFVIFLNPKTFNVNTENSILHNVNINIKENFVYGEKVRIDAFVENPGMNEIKTWTIDGVKVPETDNTIDGMTRIDADSVEIDTTVWYGLHGNNFSSEITTGMKLSIIMAITMPIGVVVLAGLILAFIILQNSKTKKKIRILLEEGRQMELKFGNVSLADQLREGKSLNITDEDVKAEMKKRKNKHAQHVEPAEPNDEV